MNISQYKGSIMTGNMTLCNLLKQGAVLMVLLLVVSQSSFSQSASKTKDDWCATDEVMERYERNNPRVAAERQRKEQQITKLIRRLREEGRVDEYIRNNNVRLKIPVVFHVVYNDPSENIDSTKIKKQIERLNKDFQRLNADTTQTRSVFDSLAAGIDFQFCLASQDPDGNPTNGITRTPTNHGDFGQFDSVKYTNQGGKDAWPQEDYLNIWVCRLGGFVSGYATVPSGLGGLGDGDGIVMRYFDIGGNERTLTHEVGHWFNLYHTFQDSCNGSSNTDCNVWGDEVCDTPQQGSSSAGCDSTLNTCSETPEYPDMIENYMSYADCQNMFTKGQKLRMLVALNYYCERFDLKYSNACGGPPDKGYVKSYPFTENFENDYFAPQFWRLSYVDGRTWQEAEGTGGFGNSQKAAKAEFYTPSQNLNNYSYAMTSQNFDLTGVNKPVAITFSYAYAPSTQSNHDSLFVRLDTNQCGYIYDQIRIWAKGGDGLATAPATQQEFVPQSSEWRRDTIRISNFPSDTIKFAFAAEPKAQGGNNIYVDDINIFIDTFATGRAPSVNANPQQLQVSPNPSNGRFRIRSSLNETKTDGVEMEVYNSVGELVLHENHQINSGGLATTIDLSQYADGFYFVKIFNRNHQLLAKEKLYKLSDRD
ncbi:MAG: hypothetical protein BRD50_00105 [Bacteroidetes bacterium SW_11_45_7]|nr:MAG: hypothetical protein BRD50_00105 [Bacteroidetes bacterium SW_11_45_7]